MTLPQYRELAAYWRKYPPAHVLLARLMGLKGDNGSPNDLGELLAGFARR